MNIIRHDFKKIEHNLKQVFDMYYSMTFGFLEMDKPDENALYPNEAASELFKKGGRFYEPFDKIYKLADRIHELECETRKNDPNFSPNEAMIEQIKDMYEDVYRRVCEVMFIHGIAYGKKIENLR